MRTIVMGMTVGAIASVLASGMATAQDLEEVKVQATRAFEKKVVGRTSSNVPIVNISISYGVSVADLDLATTAGAGELEKRVKDTARTACKEISSRYPNATPSDPECAKAAADQAMVKVHELVAAAQKPSRK